MPPHASDESNACDEPETETQPAEQPKTLDEVEVPEESNESLEEAQESSNEQQLSSMYSLSVNITGYIGFTLARREIGAGIKVASVDSATMKANGVHPGVILHSIAGKLAERMSLDQANALIRGQRPLNLTFLHRIEHTWYEEGF